MMFNQTKNNNMKAREEILDELRTELSEVQPRMERLADKMDYHALALLDEAGMEQFKLLNEQLAYMRGYCHVLRVRIKALEALG